MQLLGGLGTGLVIAHPENQVDGEANRRRYEIAGPSAQVFAGSRAWIRPGIGVAAEYKFTVSNPKVHLSTGVAGWEERTHHVSLGLVWSPGGAGGPGKDVQGCQLRDLTATSRRDGEAEFSWDGRTANGQGVPASLVFVRAAASERLRGVDRPIPDSRLGA